MYASRVLPVASLLGSKKEIIVQEAEAQVAAAVARVVAKDRAPCVGWVDVLMCNGHMDRVTVKWTKM